MSAVWKRRFETAKTVCFWLVVCFFGFWFCVGFFGIGRGEIGTEPFNPHKMSQVPRHPQRPAWAVPQKVDVERGQFQRITENLQHGLDSVPQYEWRNYQPPKPVFTPYPWREHQPPQDPCRRY